MVDVLWWIAVVSAGIWIAAVGMLEAPALMTHALLLVAVLAGALRRIVIGRGGT